MRYFLLFFLISFHCYSEQVSNVGDSAFLSPNNKDLKENTKFLFSYELKNEGQELLIQDSISVSEESLGLLYGSSQEIFSEFSQKLKVSPSVRGFFFLFNLDLVVPENYEILNQEGKIIYEDSLNPSKFWKNKIESDTAKTRQAKLFAHAHFFDEDLPEVVYKKNKKGEPFRVCFSAQSGKEFNRLCTAYYVLKKNEKNYELIPLRGTVESKIYIGKEIAKSKQKILLEKDKIFHFFIALKTGQNYEFSTYPPALEIKGVSRSENEEFVLSGFGQKPADTLEEIRNADQSPSFFRRLFSTAVEKWQIQQKEGQLKKYIRGRPYGIFTVNLDLSSLKIPQSLPQFAGTYPMGTYLSKKKVSLKIPEGGEIKDQPNVKRVNDQQLIWTLDTSKLFEENANDIPYSYKGKESVLGVSVYREPAHHLDIKLTGASTPGSYVFLLGIDWSYWFDHFLTVDRSWSTLKWGAGISYFNSLTSLGFGSETTKAALSIGKVELKYRLYPGLYERDRGFGFSLPLMFVNYSKLAASVAGVGAFFHQDFPESIGYIFEKIHPFFSGKKSFDVKLNVFAFPLTSGLTLSSNYELEVDFTMRRGRWNLLGGVAKRSYFMDSPSQNLIFDGLFFNGGVGILF